MMKERFERMTLDQLYAVRETLCYLSPRWRTMVPPLPSCLPT